jgi:PTH1 family peptidyl-tRNA hydrolase
LPRLLVGLGNPGRRYEGTRHNVGFDAVDRILSSVGGRWGSSDDLAAELRASIAEAEIEGRPVTLMKPLTYMNLSGEPVSEWARAHSIERTEVLIYLDDVALPLGSLRLRERGTDGGHNGLASVLESLGGTDVPRVRIGIRPRGPEGSEGSESAEIRAGELADFVLAPFTEEERPVVEDVLSRVVSATRMILSTPLAGGMDKAMSLYNAR